MLRERFVREARAVSALVHPNIITIHEINATDGTDFIVMEYVRGEPLSDVLSRGRLSVARAVDTPCRSRMRSRLHTRPASCTGISSRATS